MDSYLVNVEKSKVTNDSLIYYKGQRYSVSPKYIGQFVKAKQIDNMLYLYHNKELIATHKINKKIFNYTKEHYSECLKMTMPYKSDNEIDKLTQKLESAGRRNGFSCTQQKRNQLQAYFCLQPSPCRIAYYIYGFLFFIIKRQAFPAVF